MKFCNVLSDIGLQYKLYCFLPDAKAGASKNARLSTSRRKKRMKLSDDVSPIKIVTEASEVSKDTEHGILRLQKSPSSANGRIYSVEVR